MEELTAHLASLLWSYLDSFLLLVGEPAYEGYDLCVDVKARQRKTRTRPFYWRTGLA